MASNPCLKHLGLYGYHHDLLQKFASLPAGRLEVIEKLEQLRVLTAQRIRDFHREMYQPKNLRLVLVGEIDHLELLDILEKFEEGILDAIPSPDAPFKRPWIESTQAKPLANTIIDTVYFPEDDESMGEIMMAFFGPPTNDLLSGMLFPMEISNYTNSE